MNTWIDASKQLPNEGEYVLVHHTRDNWHDHRDEEGVHYKVAILERGISIDERNKLKAVNDPRGYTYRECDEDGNNLRPYYWKTFGPGGFWGQEVDYWMKLPRLHKEDQK